MDDRIGSHDADVTQRHVSRRSVLKASALGAAAAALAACTPGATASGSPGQSAGGSTAGPSAPPVSTTDPITLKLGHGFAEDHPLNVTWLEMAQAINVRTEGNVKIDIFPNSTLGTQAELKDQLALGAPIIIGYAFADGAVHVPDWAVFEAPFNFASVEEAKKVADSDLFDELSEQLFDKAGWYIFARNYANGPRHLINKVRPVNTPADLAGLKIRVPQVPVYVDTFTALGATPVPLPLPEIYPGLQQDLIDGAEGFVSQHTSLKLFEVAKNFTLTSHIWQLTGMAGGKFFTALPADLQLIISEEATNSGDVFSARQAAAATKGLTEMTAAGVTVTEPDLAPWRAATESVYDKLAGTMTPGVIDRFRSLRDA